MPKRIQRGGAKPLFIQKANVVGGEIIRSGNTGGKNAPPFIGVIIKRKKQKEKA